jgi:hypothetical protein
MNIAFSYMHLRITESCVQKPTDGLACAQGDLLGRKCKKLFITCQLKIERMNGGRHTFARGIMAKNETEAWDQHTLAVHQKLDIPMKMGVWRSGFAKCSAHCEIDAQTQILIQSRFVDLPIRG